MTWYLGNTSARDWMELFFIVSKHHLGILIPDSVNRPVKVREAITKDKMKIREMVTEGITVVERCLRELYASIRGPRTLLQGKGKRLWTEIIDIPGQNLVAWPWRRKKWDKLHEFQVTVGKWGMSSKKTDRYFQSCERRRIVLCSPFLSKHDHMGQASSCLINSSSESKQTQLLQPKVQQYILPGGKTVMQTCCNF